jgi:predicted outer membrane protein
MSRFTRIGVPLVILAPALLAAQDRPAVRDPVERPRVQTERPGFQTERPRVQTERPGFQTERPRTATANLDQHIIACLINDNEGEIKLSKWGQEKAQNTEVKDFAEQMVSDHGQFLTKLKQLQGGADAATDRVERRGDETPRVPARRPSAEPNAPPAANQAGGGHDIYLQIKKEIAERCLASIQRELEQKKGADFDRCFMGTQQMAHMKMVDQLAVLERYASPQLQRTLAQGSQTARSHLTHAKTLLAKLEGAAAETARRPGSEDKK